MGGPPTQEDLEDLVEQMRGEIYFAVARTAQRFGGILLDWGFGRFFRVTLNVLLGVHGEMAALAVAQGWIPEDLVKLDDELQQRTWLYCYQHSEMDRDFRDVLKMFSREGSE